MGRHGNLRWGARRAALPGHQRALHPHHLRAPVRARGLIGALAGTLGAEYLVALHRLVTSNLPTAVQVLGVVGFVAVEFSLVIIPFAFLMARPEATERTIQRLKGWLAGHARRLLATVALLAGSYMVISGALRLLG